MHAAVVKLYPLTDADGAGAHHQDRPPPGKRRFVLFLVGGVIAGNPVAGSGGPGVHRLVYRVQSRRQPPGLDRLLRHTGSPRQLAIAEAGSFGPAEQGSISLEPPLLHLLDHAGQELEPPYEVRGNTAPRRQFPGVQTAPACLCQDE